MLEDGNDKTNPFDVSAPETIVLSDTPSKQPVSSEPILLSSTPREHQSSPEPILLSGNTVDSTMFGFPGTVPLEEPIGFRWGQYFLGVAIPIVVVVLFAVSAEIITSSDDPYFYIDNISMEKDNDGYFSHEFIQATESWRPTWCDTQTDSPYISCSVDWSGSKDIMTVYEYESPGYGYDERVKIGEYSYENNTIWFKPVNYTDSSLTMDIEFYDESIAPYNGGSEDILFGVACFGFIAYIGAIIASFVKKKKALAYGLLTPLMVYIALIGLLIALFIFAFSQF